MLSTTRPPTRPYRRSHVLLMMSLLAVLGAAQCLALPPTVPAAASSPTIPATVHTAAMTAPAADFLASLSLDGSGAVPLSGCTSNAQCPPKQLCCLACGFPDCTAHACFAPVNGHCPLIP